MRKKYDAIIVGSGPIALSTALLLHRNNLRVAICRKDLSIVNTISPARLFAISHGSRQILQNIGVKERIAKEAQIISHIRVVDSDSYSKVDFSPHDIALEDFGYMVDESILIQI